MNNTEDYRKVNEITKLIDDLYSRKTTPKQLDYLLDAKLALRAWLFNKIEVDNTL